MGCLSSLIFFGLIIGSAIATLIIDKYQYKTILSISLLANGLALLVMTVTDIYYILCISRTVSGLAQIFATIMAPVWMDTYAPPG